MVRDAASAAQPPQKRLFPLSSPSPRARRLRRPYNPARSAGWRLRGEKWTIPPNAAGKAPQLRPLLRGCQDACGAENACAAATQYPIRVRCSAVMPLQAKPRFPVRHQRIPKRWHVSQTPWSSAPSRPGSECVRQSRRKDVRLKATRHSD